MIDVESALPVPDCVFPKVWSAHAGVSLLSEEGRRAIKRAFD